MRFATPLCARPDRTILIDGDDTASPAPACTTGAAALARNLLSRMPVGSVVSFMLPNWHEAAVVYLGATLAGMVVNPILPSLRDRELRFILDDVDSRMIFVPGEFRGHDYAAMLDRVTAQLDQPPEVVVVRGTPAAHRLRRHCSSRRAGTARPRARSRRRADDPVHLGYHWPSQRGTAHP